MKLPSKEFVREHALKWLDALESGKYPQTDGALATDAGFCCLGVFCEVNAPELKKVRVEDDDDRIYYGTSAEILPDEVVTKFGFKNQNPVARALNPDFDYDNLDDGNADYDVYGNSRYIETNLAELNDDHGMSFKEIADAIRRSSSSVFIYDLDLSKK